MPSLITFKILAIYLNEIPALLSQWCVFKANGAVDASFSINWATGIKVV